MRIRKRCCENLKVSLCYYLRNKDDVKVRQIKYVILDSEQEILKTNYQQPIKYVPIGDIEGIGYFKYALNIATENLHTFMEINEKAIQRMLTTNNKQ